MAADRLAAAGLVESVWLERTKYEAAEARFQEIIAQQHAQLEVVGKAVGGGVCITDVAELIGQTQSMIEEKLRSTASKTPSTVVALGQRVSKLEAENEDLKKRVAALEKVFASRRVIAEPAKVQQQVDDDFDLFGSDEEPAKVQQQSDDDDFDLFGSDEEADKEAERLKQERLAKYHQKKSARPAVVAKSSIVLEVKPWDDETDLNKMEQCVRSIKADGLVWQASKFVPVGYGINKLQISCVVEDEKIGTDFLEEEITQFEDLVQSVDIAAFNKI